MAKDPTPEEAGLAGVWIVDPATEKEWTLAELASREHVVSLRYPALRLELAEGAGPARVWQELDGRALPEDAVVAQEGGRYLLAHGLFRGENAVQVELEGRPRLRVPLVHRGALADWARILLHTFVAFVLLKTYVAQIFYIPSGSMRDTLEIGDYVLVDRVSRFAGRAGVGDVIVFQFPKDPSKDYIKRKVADQGEVVAVVGKQLTRDGVCHQEPYAVFKDPVLRPRGLDPRDWMPPVPIPPEHSWAMGDNRDNSLDSRFWGPLADYRVKGRALLVYWPPSRWKWIRSGRPREVPCGPGR